MLLQFHDIADLVELAQRKRTYILKSSLLRQDFHPWEWPDDRVDRKDTVRPIPADFWLDRRTRQDRNRRLQEAVALFGEAEREVRVLARSLRAEGYDVRRPHPNAQSILVRVRPGGRTAVDYPVAPTPNGLWQVSRPTPDNQTRARAQRRAERVGMLSALLKTVGVFRDVQTSARVAHPLQR